MTDENIIVRAARAQREVWETIEQQDAEIQRLRTLITAWADAEEADHAALGMEMGTHQSCECTPWCALRKVVGR